MMKYLWMKAETESGNKIIAALNDFHKLTTYVKENGGKVLQKLRLWGEVKEWISPWRESLS